MKTIVLVDGYNVIHGVPEWERRMAQSLEAGREGLIRHCTTWLATRRDVAEFHLVFDGHSDVPTFQTHAARGVRITFTKTGESADEHILQLLDGLADPAAAVVVSNDNRVRNGARSFGARILSVAEFAETLPAAPPPRRRQSAASPRRTDGGKPRLTPAQEHDLNAQLRKAWRLP